MLFNPSAESSHEWRHKVKRRFLERVSTFWNIIGENKVGKDWGKCRGGSVGIGWERSQGEPRQSGNLLASLRLKVRVIRHPIFKK